MDEGGHADAIVYKQIREITDGLSIDEALKTWLYRTPIYGSLPGDPADDVLVDRWVNNYMDAFAAAANESLKVRSHV